MISVCMAVYNGKRFLCEQLASILCQLATDDEIVVVDDGSSDDTLELVKGLNDPRIRVLVNSCNQGVLRSFERAIKEARGDIIFLSDQDDIWLPRKVCRFLEAFSVDGHIVLVISDAQVIDEEGKELAASFFAQRGGFVSGWFANLLKNRFLGCALAFRSSLKDVILPFPKDIPMHDMWIGTLADLKGRVKYIDEPLIAYRRHLSNASPIKRAGLLQIIVWRWRLSKNLLLRSMRRH